MDKPGPDNVADFELLTAWKNGDDDAADALMRRHYASVRRFFDLKVNEAAEDLTQQTLLGAVEGLDAYRGEAGFKAYLFGIARKQLLRFLRKRGRMEGAMRFAADSEPTLKTSLSVVAARKEEHQLMLMALAQLPTDLQIAVELYYWEDMRTADIGEVIEVGASTVASRLARARELVRQHIVEMTRPGRVRDSLIANLELWQRSLGPLTAAANARR